MKPILVALLGFLPQAVSGAEQVVTLGDSLTFAYEVEFGTGLSVPGVGSFAGDGFGSEVRNWIEILSAPGYRPDQFDQGGEVSVTFLFFLEFFIRREYNWAIPGSRIDDLRRFLAEEATITQLLVETDNFGALADFILLSDFANSDYDVTELEGQLANTAERVVLFIGGNDVNGVYNSIYTNNEAGTFVADFIDDATWIVDWVQARNPGIEFVLVNVPHIGITPLIKSRFPPDPVGTGRVTTILDDLNAQLAALATSRNIGYADIYQATLPLLDSAPLCLHGIPFANSGSTTGDLDFVWLNGPVSDNFHPNTNAQALIGNVILQAFNDRYGIGAAPLTAGEMLGGLLGKSAGEIDMPFADWMTCFGFPGGSFSDDDDRDGLAAGLEFALGLDPTVRDAGRVSSGLVEVSGDRFLEIAYPSRLPVSARYSLTAQGGPGLQFSPLPSVPGADGLLRARLPTDGERGFLQLEAVLVP